MFEHFNKTTGIIAGAALAIIIWILGVIIGQEQTITILNPDRDLKTIINRSPKITVSLMLDYQNGQVEIFPEAPLTYSQSVFDLLLKLNQSPENKLQFKYNLDKQTGKLIDFSISELVSYPEGREWLVWLNNKLQTLPINQIKLKARDTVELKYIKLISNF